MTQRPLRSCTFGANRGELAKGISPRPGCPISRVLWREVGILISAPVGSIGPTFSWASPLKYLLSLSCGLRYGPEYVQNPEPQGLTRKILRDKGLRLEFSLLDSWMLCFPSCFQALRHSRHLSDLIPNAARNLFLLPSSFPAPISSLAVPKSSVKVVRHIPRQGKPILPWKTRKCEADIPVRRL
jgi:hypothetical protein